MPISLTVLLLLLLELAALKVTTLGRYIALETGSILLFWVEVEDRQVGCNNFLQLLY